MDRAGRRLASSAIAVAGQASEAFVEISYIGGVFRSGELVMRSFKEEISSSIPGAHVIPPRLPPALGAVLLVVPKQGTCPFLENLEVSSKEWEWDEAPADEISVLSRLLSDQPNPVSSALDDIPLGDVLELINSEDHQIAPVVGPEVVAGSTRMKTGTAQKLILNMISTATMVRLGRVKGNLMVAVQPKSEKLRERAKRLVAKLADVSNETAENALEDSCWDVGHAIEILNAHS